MLRIPFRAQPMLATLVAEPFRAPGWIFQEKYDGDRILAYKEGARVRLLSRNGKDRTERFPDVVKAIAGLAEPALLLDGEMVIFDKAGISRFQLLQKGEGRAVFALFDCLFGRGRDLRDETLARRMAFLEKTVKGRGPLRLARDLGRDGIAAFRKAKKAGFEGIVAKDLSSPYVAGRSTFWRKVKIHQEDEFIVIGFTAPAGARRHFGALLLGAHDRGKLRYMGKVGTGFDRKTLADLHARLRPLVIGDSPVPGVPGRTNTYVKPVLVAEIAYQEITADGLLRQPVYLGMRDDKAARDVTVPGT